MCPEADAGFETKLNHIRSRLNHVDLFRYISVPIMNQIGNQSFALHQ